MRPLVPLLLVLASMACGPRRVPPATYLLDTPALPAYERSIDHAGLIGDLDKDAVARGMVTYRNTCYSCHGDPEQPGSLPTARRFWQEPFRNGADPHAIYQTLTRGYGLMPPQVR
ncbi:c-type cytochrome, partial [Luteitalea sp.]|uniref:c-type cytochrome n=1 Tax=Luteitalea sp. TaxID=2004800 RepID=UPI0037C5EAA2